MFIPTYNLPMSFDVTYIYMYGKNMYLFYRASTLRTWWRTPRRWSRSRPAPAACCWSSSTRTAARRPKCAKRRQGFNIGSLQDMFFSSYLWFDTNLLQTISDFCYFLIECVSLISYGRNLKEKKQCCRNSSREDLIVKIYKLDRVHWKGGGRGWGWMGLISGNSDTILSKSNKWLSVRARKLDCIPRKNE